MTDTERYHRRRRGVVRGMITRLTTRFVDLKLKIEQPETLSHTRQMAQRLRSLDSEFKQHHFAIVDLIERDEDLDKEQNVLDDYEDQISDLTVAIEMLISECTPTSKYSNDGRRLLSRKLAHIKKHVDLAAMAIEADSVDDCLLKQYEEQLSDYKKELAGVLNELLALDVVETDELNETHLFLEDGIFQTSLKIRKLLQAKANTCATDALLQEGEGFKLPKLEIPQFDGHRMNFWEQFSISVHSRLGLADAEKLVCL